MKPLLLFLLLLPLAAFSQNWASQRRDTISYGGRTFAAGDTVQLGYGSNTDKEFVFVGTGKSELWGIDPLEATYAKRKIVVNKVEVKKGKSYAFGQLVNKTFSTRFIIRIDIEGALDNKEIF